MFENELSYVCGLCQMKNEKKATFCREVTLKTEIQPICESDL
jgi:hypothetical protein